MSNWRPKERAGLGPQIDIAREWPAKPASQPVSQKGRIEAFQKLEIRNFKTRKSCPWSGIPLFIVTPLAKKVSPIKGIPDHGHYFPSLISRNISLLLAGRLAAGWLVGWLLAAGWLAWLAGWLAGWLDGWLPG